MGAGMLLLVAVFYGAWLPGLEDLKISPRVADVLRAEGATRVGDAIMIDYKEPSLAFYQGGTIREESNNRFLIETNPLVWPRSIVLTRRVWDSLPRDMRETRFDHVATVEGWWYASGGKRVQVLVKQKRSVPLHPPGPAR
jgi:hypothetical protein